MPLPTTISYPPAEMVDFCEASRLCKKFLELIVAIHASHA